MAKLERLIEGLRVGKDNVELSLLQYADDTLIFLPHNAEKILNIKRIMQCFSIMSGFDINFSTTWESISP